MFLNTSSESTFNSHYILCWCHSEFGNPHMGKFPCHQLWYFPYPCGLPGQLCLTYSLHCLCSCDPLSSPSCFCDSVHFIITYIISLVCFTTFSAYVFAGCSLTKLGDIMVVVLVYQIETRGNDGEGSYILPPWWPHNTTDYEFNTPS